ncbi:tRNA (adenosine(37)-N6)-threonylcarbamoyltransferase complex dimerization subunit type 1 TsaB [Clostridium cellulovorans]|uniref:Peptidase M22 glycoprotease n=1 Tax=Clostridium cellulovorans (strain ATCC 35296 / DSM 3052 / OCM 3 / 743B) TaxID=573061 RepID=D9STI5_CLOC7|nr:tRNA (adenosine(37)-N6)-threonylcarbamoyltransferase complex dimerization subunit type 1 TsaB [Clostridium cellulovorans]ADL52719.1 peptidase M22 glycoprotease [Clostridium cellulovorans 743B]
MKVLAVDSSSECASVAIIDDNRLLGEITYNYKKQHSVIMMEMIDTILKNTSMTVKDIDGFVVSKGPGSFTGLRIGMASVKGLAQGTKKPMISISSLDALAYNLAYTEGILCPIFDALRNNVYTALYHFDGVKLIRLTDYLNLSVDELVVLLKEKNDKVTFIGDDVYKFKEKLLSVTNCNFAPRNLNATRASSLGELGQISLQAGISDDLITVAPLYIRNSQAENEYEARNGKSVYED